MDKKRDAKRQDDECEAQGGADNPEGFFLNERTQTLISLIHAAPLDKI
jgi:hypothetical protein